MHFKIDIITWLEIFGILKFFIINANFLLFLAFLREYFTFSIFVPYLFFNIDEFLTNDFGLSFGILFYF